MQRIKNKKNVIIISTLLLMFATPTIFAVSMLNSGSQTDVYQAKAGCMMCHQMGSITPVETDKKPETRAITKKKKV